MPTLLNFKRKFEVQTVICDFVLYQTGVERYILSCHYTTFSKCKKIVGCEVIHNPYPSLILIRLKIVILKKPLTLLKIYINTTITMNIGSQRETGDWSVN